MNTSNDTLPSGIPSIGSADKPLTNEVASGPAISVPTPPEDRAEVMARMFADTEPQRQSYRRREASAGLVDKILRLMHLRK